MEGKLEKLIAYLFYGLLFLTPIIFFPKTSELFEFNKMVLTYVFTILIIFVWIIKMISQKKFTLGGKRRTTLDIALLIFLGVQLLSTLVSFDQRISLLGYYSRFHGGLISSLSYALLFWAWVSNMDRQKTKKAIYVLLASAVLVSIYGVLQHFGIDRDLWVQDVQNRIFSTLGQPNWLAAWIVSLIPITWAFAIQKSKHKILSGKKSFWLWTSLSALFFLTLLFTKSRSGLLGFTVSYLIFWGIYFWQNPNRLKHPKSFLTISFSFLIIGLIIGTPWSPGIDKALNRQALPQNIVGPALEVGGTESAEIRKIVWKGAINIWKNYPILGTGVETFALSYYNFRPQEHNLVSEWDFIYNKAHNEYLNFAATSGTAGLVSYFFLIGAILWLFLKKNLKSSTFVFWNLAFISGFASILVTNFFGFSVVPVALIFFLYPAMSITLSKSNRQENYEKLDNRQRAALTFVSLVAFYLLFITARYWYADLVFNKGKFMNRSGEFLSGREALVKAVELSPKEAIFWDELANATTNIAIELLENGDINLAQETANLAIQESDSALFLSPKNVNLKRKRAQMYLKLSSFDTNYLSEAGKTFQEAISLAPTDAKLFYNLGLTQARLGQFTEAIDTLEHTVNIKPNYRNARFALGLLLVDVGEREKGKQELIYILENIEPNDELVKQELEEI